MAAPCALWALGLLLLLGSYVVVGYSGYAKQAPAEKPVARSAVISTRSKRL